MPDAEPDERAQPDGGAANATTLAQLRDAVAKTMRARAAAAAEEARPVAPTIAIARAEPDDAAARLRASFRAAVATETERRLTAADPAVAIAAAGPREPIVLAPAVKAIASLETNIADAVPSLPQAAEKVVVAAKPLPAFLVDEAARSRAVALAALKSKPLPSFLEQEAGDTAARSAIAFAAHRPSAATDSPI